MKTLLHVIMITLLCISSSLADVTVTRSFVTTGDSLTVTLQIVVSTPGPTGLIVEEIIPAGWGLSSANPKQSSFDSTAGEIGWVLFDADGVEDQEINYVLTAPNPIPGNCAINGIFKYLENSTEVVQPIAGDNGPREPPTTRVAGILEDLEGEPGGIVSIPLSVSNADDVVGFFFVLQYDSTILHFVDTDRGSLTGGWGDPIVSDINGQVSVASAGTSPLSGNGSLVILKFNIDSQAAVGVSSPLSVTVAELNDGAILADMSSGKITIGTSPATPTPTPATPSDFEPDFVFEFEGEYITDENWAVYPGGFGGALAGTVRIAQIPTGSSPSYTNGRGLEFTNGPTSVMLLFGPAIETDGFPVLLRVAARTTSESVSLALGALDGSLDGSIGLDHCFTAEKLLDKYGYLQVVYNPPSGVFYPILQVASGEKTGLPFKTYMDNLEIYFVKDGKAIPKNLLELE